MKAVKEALSPTRVKLTVEVPFEELQPALTAAYKKIASQVRVQGFRPGKVPPRIIDQRVGRTAVLDEAVNGALPRLYTDAASEQEVRPVAQPTVDVTSFGDGEPLVFTAEVDVRPEFELPDYDGLAVTVDAVEVSDDDVDQQLTLLRQRFGTLEGVERPVATGDYVLIDLAAERDGEPVPDATASGLSYEVGSDSLVPGLDEALVGLTPDASATFESELVGESAGAAQVTVTVRTVRQQVLPDLDDDFATTASEFDTLDELKAAIRDRAAAMKRVEQGVQARDRTLEALLGLVDIPLPESAIDGEVEGRLHGMGHELESIGQTLESYLDLQGKDRAEFDAELREGATRSVKATFVLDAVAAKEELGITDEELTDQVVRRAQRAGTPPQEYANQLMQSGQLPLLVSEIVRGKALALVMEAAVVTDTDGNRVDLDALGGERPSAAAADADAEVNDSAAGESAAGESAADDSATDVSVADPAAE
ncbi:MAG TPA: trigger factor [Mycobacteriales bacterium]